MALPVTKISCIAFIVRQARTARQFPWCPDISKVRPSVVGSFVFPSCPTFSVDVLSLHVVEKRAFPERGQPSFQTTSVSRFVLSAFYGTVSLTDVWQ